MAEQDVQEGVKYWDYLDIVDHVQRWKKVPEVFVEALHYNAMKQNRDQLAQENARLKAERDELHAPLERTITDEDRDLQELIRLGEERP